MSHHGWSWSLRIVLVLAVAAAVWAGAAAVALGALQQHAVAGARAAATHSATRR